MRAYGAPTNVPYKESRCKRPVGTLLVADSTRGGGYQTNGFYQLNPKVIGATGTEAGFGGRHNKLDNIIWADGHVNAMDCRKFNVEYSATNGNHFETTASPNWENTGNNYRYEPPYRYGLK